MVATAKDIVDAGFESEVVKIGDLAIEVRSMTVNQAFKFSAYSQEQKDKMLVFAYLIKLCCPAFSGWLWTPKKIAKKLAPKIMVELASKVMEVSGYRTDAVDESLKD